MSVGNGRVAWNLGIFSQLLSKFENLHHVSVLNPKHLEEDILNFFNNFLRFLFEGGINEYEDDEEYAPKGCISFLTIHQSKGLEFPIVVCGSLDAVPRKQDTKLDRLLEDKGYLSKPRFEPLEHIKCFDFRRLFYTAFSRAQNLLVLATEVRKRRGLGSSPSKYFKDVFNPLPNWRALNLKEFKFEPVKEIHLKREYSFTSHIALFENCPEQYRFFKELGFVPVRVSPMLFGTLVHQTIEDIHKAVLRGEEKNLTGDLIKSWLFSNYTMLSKKERVYLAPETKEAALQHVMRYFERENGRWERIKEAEVEISLVKKRYILKGSVDLIRGDHDTVEIVDFKSEKKPDSDRESERLQRYKRQLEVYAHLVEERTGQKVSKMHLFFSGEESGDPYLSFPKNEETVKNTIARFDEIVGRIEQKDYKTSTRPKKLCENCDLRAYCGRKNAISGADHP